MRLIPERDPLPRLLAFVYAAIGGAAWWLIEHQILFDTDRYACPLLAHTGVACPTCGGTHAGLALGRLDVIGAFTENPLIALGLVGLGLWFVYAVLATAVPRLRVNLRTSRGEARVIRILALALVVGTWIYEINRHARG